MARYHPPQLFSHDGGALLELSLELYQKKFISPFSISLLIYSEQGQLLKQLAKTQYIHLFAYTHTTFIFCGQVHARWPEMYRRNIPQQPQSPMKWKEIRDYWIFQVYRTKSQASSRAIAKPSISDSRVTKQPHKTPNPSAEPLDAPSHSPKPIPQSDLPSQPPTISRYINKQQEKATQGAATPKQRQQAILIETAIDSSNKYLWTQSAWTMTEALRHNTDGTSLALPENHVYIELEPPHQLNGQVIAVCIMQSEINPSIASLAAVCDELVPFTQTNDNRSRKDLKLS